MQLFCSKRKKSTKLSQQSLISLLSALCAAFKSHGIIRSPDLFFEITVCTPRGISCLCLCRGSMKPAVILFLILYDLNAARFNTGDGFFLCTFRFFLWCSFLQTHHCVDSEVKTQRVVSRVDESYSEEKKKVYFLNKEPELSSTNADIQI